MKNIRIIEGTYGHRPGAGNKVVPVDRGQCCEVPDEEAARLVSIKVAEYAEEPVATPPGGTNDGGTGTNTPDGSVPPTAPAAFRVEELPEKAEALDIVDGHFTEESLSRLKNAELKALAIDLGLDPGKCGNKAEFVSLLLPVEIVEDEAEDDGSVPPTAPGDTIVQ